MSIITRGLGVDYITGSGGGTTNPTISNIVVSSYSITVADILVITCDISEAVDEVLTTINGKVFAFVNTGANSWTANIVGRTIGECVGQSIVITATKSGAGNRAVAPSTLDVVATTYTNYEYLLIQDLQGLLQSEFSDIPIMIGDRPYLPSVPCIILEPITKNISQEITMGMKDFEFPIDIVIYTYSDDEEQAIKLCSEIAEKTENLLIDNVQYPVNDGDNWYKSKANSVEYGQTSKTGQVLRSCILNYTFNKRVIR